MDFWHILAFICGIVVCWAFMALSKRYALSLVRSENGKKGVLAKQDAAEDLFSFIADMKAAFEKHKAEGKTLQSFGLQVAPSIIAQHPKTAIRFGTRLYKMLKEGQGIEELINGGLLPE